MKEVSRAFWVGKVPVKGSVIFFKVTVAFCSFSHYLDPMNVMRRKEVLFCHNPGYILSFLNFKMVRVIFSEP